jgi:hypothetical protein
MVQMLEARRAAEVQVDDVRQVAVLGVEEADRLAGGQREVVVDCGQRLKIAVFKILVGLSAPGS